MDARLPAEFDPQQVSLFLDKIAADCDAELRDIAANRDAEIARIQAEAHAESRRLFRQNAEQLRARLDIERSRYLARVRSELRRQQWEVLVKSQQRVLEAVSNRFAEAWRDPDRQWEWCQYWLALALDRAGDNSLRIFLGNGGLESVGAKIEQAIAGHPAATSVTIDPDSASGIRIEWGDYVMDGRLNSQTEAISDAILSRLSDLLDQQQQDSTS